MDKQLIDIIKSSSSWDEFKSEVIKAYSKPEDMPGLNIEIDPLPEKLSDFNKKLQQGLNWNPKNLDK